MTTLMDLESRADAVSTEHFLRLASHGVELMAESIHRHQRQIRALQDALRQQRGGGGNTGSAVLDCVCEHAMVPNLKDARPAWKGLRTVDIEVEYEDDIWTEIEWCATLYRVRTTCRAARMFHNGGGEVDTYLRESKSRHAAMRMWSTLYRQRGRYMRDRLGLEWGDDRRMMPQRCIDETWDSVEASHPGLRDRIDDGSLGEL